MARALPSPTPARPERPRPTPVDSLDLARRLVALAREKRAEDATLLDVRGLVDYTDFFLLLTGTSARQNQAIGEHLSRTMKGEGRYPISKAGLDTGSWICLDLGDVVVHVFDPETRARYDLELLWADAPRADVEATPAPAPEAAAKPKRQRVARKAAVADADEANAPESDRPPLDEPEAEKPKAKPAPRAPARGKAGPRAEKKPPAKKRRPPR
jgi:ribosome-associated protein